MTQYEYRVTAVIQSADIDNNRPVDVQWYSGDNLAKAVSAMVSAAVHDEDVDHGDLPKQMRYRTLSVRLDKVKVLVAEAEPSASPSTGICSYKGGPHKGLHQQIKDGEYPCVAWNEWH